MQKDYSNETSVKVREAYADGFLAGALPQSTWAAGQKDNSRALQVRQGAPPQSRRESHSTRVPIRQPSTVSAREGETEPAGLDQGPGWGVGKGAEPGGHGDTLLCLSPEASGFHPGSPSPPPVPPCAWGGGPWTSAETGSRGPLWLNGAGDELGRLHSRTEELPLPPTLPPACGLAAETAARPQPSLHPRGQQTALAPTPGFLRTLGSDTLASERLVLQIGRAHV